MAQFDLAFSKAMQLETRLPDDGEAVTYGASLRWLGTMLQLRGTLSEQDLNGNGKLEIKDLIELPRQQQAAVYKTGWWDRYKYGFMDPQPLAEKVFITAMNIGAVPANKLLQRALCAHGQEVVIDGMMGDLTFRGIRFVSSRESWGSLVATFRAEQAAYYREIAALNPKVAKHLPTWLQRAYL